MNEPAYYNENDPYAVRWLRNLMAAGLIPEGRVDDRSITEVGPADLAEYGQAHFFAGIAGWSFALQLAGWPADRPVWTGSCPCQPFSQAGKRRGTADRRHLWPVWRELIRECRPPTIFGEQVASADGRAWLAGVRADLEEMGYAVGAADLCAAGVDAPHIRQRLWWVADSEHAERRKINVDREDGCNGQNQGRKKAYCKFGACCEVCGLADSGGERRQQVTESASCDEGTNGRRKEGNHITASSGTNNGMANSHEWAPEGIEIGKPGCGENGGLGDPERDGRQQGTQDVRQGEPQPPEPVEVDA